MDSDASVSTVENLYGGLKETLSWWDLSIVALGIAGRLDGFYSERHIDFPVIKFDQKFTDRVARDDGGSSFGTRVNPNDLSWAIITTPLAVTAALDQFSVLSVDRNDYFKPSGSPRRTC